MLRKPRHLAGPTVKTGTTGTGFPDQILVGTAATDPTALTAPTAEKVDKAVPSFYKSERCYPAST
jgi:hypothetical protein